MLCRRCGYELRGLLADGQCPECSFAVEKSTGDETLLAAEPTWLKKLAIGCRLFVIGVLGILILVTATFVVSMIGGFLTGTGKANASIVSSPEFLILNTTLTTAMSLLVLIGAWLLTERDPGARAEPAGFNARIIARFGLILSLVTSPWGMFLSQSMGSMTQSKEGFQGSLMLTVLTLVGIVLSLLAAIGWGGYCLHLSRIMGRLPSRALTRQCRFLMWAYPIGLSIFAGSGMAFVLIMPFIGPGQMSGNMSPGTMAAVLTASAGSCIGTISYFVFSTWLVIMHWILARRLKTALVAGS